MKEPTTPDEIRDLHRVLRTDPQRYLQITSEWIGANPRNSHAYYDRHFGWMKIGEPRRALEDLNKVIELSPEQIAFASRGAVYRHMGDYRKAIDDFERGETIDPAAWNGNPIALVHQADCYARLGDEAKALAYGGRLSDTFYMPGLGRPPAGYKPDVLDELRRIAARARSNRNERT
jgi:tetratricopeptide (TPR) repeat protein